MYRRNEKFEYSNPLIELYVIPLVYKGQNQGREFEPGPVPYFRGDWLWNNFYVQSLPFRWMNHSRMVVVSCERKYAHELVKACPGKSVVRWTDRPVMTIAVDWDVKQQNQTNKLQKVKTYSSHRPYERECHRPLSPAFFFSLSLGRWGVLCPWYFSVFYSNVAACSVF